MGCEISQVYFDFLDARITTELTDGERLNGREWGGVLCVSSGIYINQTLGNVTPEQAEELYQKIFTFFPHLEERLQRERERGFRPPVIECSHEIGELGKNATGANIQVPVENQKVRPLSVDVEDLI